MVQKYPVKYLADPKGVFPPPQSYYYWIGQKGFSEEYPHAREAMASVYVPLADITAINSAVNDGKTMDQAVASWIEDHADLIKRWQNIKMILPDHPAVAGWSSQAQQEKPAIGSRGTL